jgi:hypothetical protein
VNGYTWVSLVALGAWLVLALSGYRAYRVGARKTLLMVTAWVGLFLLVTGLFVAFGE